MDKFVVGDLVTHKSFGSCIWKVNVFVSKDYIQIILIDNKETKYLQRPNFVPGFIWGANPEYLTLINRTNFRRPLGLRYESR